MSYRAGTRGLEAMGVASGDPRIICDECGDVLPIGPWPPQWFLDNKPKPGWAKSVRIRFTQSGHTSTDRPGCVYELKAEQLTLEATR